MIAWKYFITICFWTENVFESLLCWWWWWLQFTKTNTKTSSSCLSGWVHLFLHILRRTSSSCSEGNSIMGRRWTEVSKRTLCSLSNVTLDDRTPWSEQLYFCRHICTTTCISTTSRRTPGWSQISLVLPHHAAPTRSDLKLPRRCLFILLKSIFIHSIISSMGTSKGLLKFYLSVSLSFLDDSLFQPQGGRLPQQI